MTVSDIFLPTSIWLRKKSSIETEFVSSSVSRKTHIEDDEFGINENDILALQKEFGFNVDKIVN